MSGPENGHFAADQDVLERFVLGRMSQAERATAQEHLDACAVCRRAVEQERLLATAVRAHARAQLKERLSQKIDLQPQGFPWPHILAAAAIVVIITGIGLMAGWLELFVQHPPAVQTDSAAATILQKEAPLPLPAERGAGAPTAAKEKAVRQTVSSSAPTPVPDAERSNQPAPQSMRNDEVLTAGQQEIKKKEAVAPVATPGYGLSSNESLVFGQIMRTTDYGDRAGKVGTLQPSFNSRAATESLHERFSSQAAPQQAQQVRVQLQPRASLARWNPGALRDTTQVPTLFNQRGDTLFLTPFVSDAQDSNRVLIEMPTLDSIVVKLPGRMIGYRVPAQFQKQR